MKKIFITILAIHLFVGTGAIAGGLGALFNPIAPMGISTDALKAGPFENFLIPGLFLFIVIGLGNLTGAVFAVFKSHIQSYITGTLGIILALWIIIQCLILQTVNFLHIIFLIIGAIQAVLALVLAFNENIYPVKLFHKLMKRDR